MLIQSNMFKFSNIFTDHSKEFFFFVDHFLLFVFRVCHAVWSVSVDTCWERAGLTAVLYVMSACVFSLSHMVSQVRRGIDS